MIFSSLLTLLFSAHLPVGQEMVAISECSGDIGDATQPLNMDTRFREAVVRERSCSVCLGYLLSNTVCYHPASFTIVICILALLDCSCPRVHPEHRGFTLGAAIKILSFQHSDSMLLNMRPGDSVIWVVVWGRVFKVYTWNYSH